MSSPHMRRHEARWKQASAELVDAAAAYAARHADDPAALDRLDAVLAALEATLTDRSISLFEFRTAINTIREATA